MKVFRIGLLSALLILMMSMVTYAGTVQISLANLSEVRNIILRFYARNFPSYTLTSATDNSLIFTSSGQTQWRGYGVWRDMFTMVTNSDRTVTLNMRADLQYSGNNLFNPGAADLTERELYGLRRFRELCDGIYTYGFDHEKGKITEVDPYGAAAAEGLQVGDRIKLIDGRKWDDPNVIFHYGERAYIEVTVKGKGGERTVRLKGDYHTPREAQEAHGI